MMKDCMLDLETMDVKPNAAIIQISAVQFCPYTGEVGKKFDKVISLQSSIDYGLSVGAGAIKFWMSDDCTTPEARQKVMSGQDELPKALRKFNKWLVNNNIRMLWGNGTASDNVWLRSAYDAVGIEPVLNFRSDMDFRTMRSLARDLGYVSDIEFKGEEHNAIDDCLHQIETLVDIFKYLNIRNQNDNSRT